MRLKFLITKALVLFAVSSPCFAKGQHIICHLDGVVNHEGAKSNVERTLGFYLDDSGEKLVAEGGDIEVRTTMYSDTIIDAEIGDVWGDYVSLFGSITNGPGRLRIDRRGSITIVAPLLPHGADVETGNCQLVTPPPQKF